MDDSPGVILKLTFENMSPVMENFLYCLVILILSIIVYIYLMIIDFIAIRIMYIRERKLQNLYYTQIN